MRRASFKHTQEQMRIGAASAQASPDGFSCAGKDITRRLNWQWAKPGMFLLAVSKSQGIRPGEIVEAFGVIQILDVRREPLCDMRPSDCGREGFPSMDVPAFVRMFCTHMGGYPQQEVARVVFHHVDVRRAPAGLLALTQTQADVLGVGNLYFHAKAAA